MRSRVRSLIIITGAGLAACLAGSGISTAQPGSVPAGPPAGAAVPGGYTQVVAAATVGANGGTVNGAIDGGSVNVTAPAGALPEGSQLRVTTASRAEVAAGLPELGYPGYTVSATVGVGVYNADGSKNTNFFNGPVTVTVTGPAIAPGQIVLRLNSTTDASRADARVSAGQAVITITADPSFAVVAPPAGVPDATTAETGSWPGPWSGTVVGLVLLAAGAVGALAMVTLRRRPAQRAR